MQDRVGQVPLLFLQVGDFFFDRVATDQAVRKDAVRLADPVSPVDRLRFDGRVPPRIEQKDVLSRSQVQTEPARFKTDEEDRAVLVILKPLDVIFAVSCLTVEVLVDDAFFVEVFPNDRQQAGEL